MKNTLEAGGRLTVFLNQVIPDRKDYREKLGQSYSSIYNYMTNEKQPGTELIKKLILLDCNINWLFTGEGSMFVETTFRQTKRRDKIKSIVTHLTKALTEAEELQKELT